MNGDVSRAGQMGGGQRASFGSRFIALLIDGVIQFVGWIVAIYVLPPVLALLVLLGGGIAYAIYFEGGQTGQTPGKKAMNIRVVDAITFGPLGAGKAAFRYFGRIVSGIPCSLGNLWALWDPEQQTWHDKIAGTFVVSASAYPVAASSEAIQSDRPKIATNGGAIHASQTKRSAVRPVDTAPGCSRCGRSLRSGAEFCPGCGYRTRSEEPMPSKFLAPPPPPPQASVPSAGLPSSLSPPPPPPPRPIETPPKPPPLPPMQGSTSFAPPPPLIDRARLLPPSSPEPLDQGDRDIDMTSARQFDLGLAPPTVSKEARDAAILLVFKGADQGRGWFVRTSTWTIGRGDDCDSVLDDKAVSRHHARLQYQHDAWHCEDFGSSNGTWVNKSKINATPLTDGDLITIGHTVLVFTSVSLHTRPRSANESA